ncbi:MAG: hypothetical protein WD749_01255 [Phycisphaerales bacterium]
MSQAPLMLGVSGLRGITGQSLTPEVAERFARAFGVWLRSIRDEYSPDDYTPRVVVGRDGRAGGEIIAEAAIRGLLEAGCRVANVGVASTPSIGHHMRCSYHAGLVVTASHNPQEWNGLKCLLLDMGDLDVSAPSSATAQAIIEVFRAPPRDLGPPPEPPTREEVPGAAENHSGTVVVSLDKGTCDQIEQRRFHVVLDSVNASGAWCGRYLLEDLRCRLEHLNADPSGLFPHPPEPTRENLTSLCDAVRAHNADIGFAQDPDADRLAIVDERGHYIGEEYTLALAAESLLGVPRHSVPGRSSSPTDRLGEPGYTLVTNLSTSRMLDDLAARHGARVIRTPVGEANVVEAMKREKAAGANVVLGGEGNGGVIWPRVTYVRDSLSAMALVLALMARSGKTVSQLVADLPRYAIEKRKVDLARKEDAAPAIAKLKSFYSGTGVPPVSSSSTGVPPVGPQRIDLQDGIRIDFTTGPRAGKAWLHVRASNTEPIMRLIAEAPTEPDARAILDEAAAIIG